MRPTPNPRRRPPPLESRFRVGEIFAPRFWVFDDNHIYGPSHWRMRWEHQGPVECQIDGSLHGVYAWHHVGPILEWLAKHQTEPVVVGIVGLWGSVIEYEFGYRAQFARVYRLLYKIVDGGQPVIDAQLMRLRRNYGVSQ